MIFLHALILTFNRKTVDSSAIWTRTLLGTVCRSISRAIRPVYTITFWARHLQRCYFFSARHGTARLHLSFCRAGLKIGTGPSTGAILTAHTDFFHGTARLSVYTCVKAGTAYFVVRGTAKNLHSLHYQKILAVPCPKRYSVNRVIESLGTVCSFNHKIFSGRLNAVGEGSRDLKGCFPVSAQNT